MADPGAAEMPGPGAYGRDLTQSWLAAAQSPDSLAPAFGSSIARQAYRFLPFASFWNHIIVGGYGHDVTQSWLAAAQKAWHLHLAPALPGKHQ